MGKPEEAANSATGDAAGAAEPAPREYRAAELAERAGITRRTLRFYRERRLLPPPRREGRIAWYDEHHLARLRTIGALLARGHTLGGIAELITAFERGGDGRGTAELLGLEELMGGSWSHEVPVRLAPEELADRFEGGVTADDLAAALDLGYVRVDGDHLVHTSQRLLEVSSELVRQGVPLSAVLAAGRQIRAHADAIAVLCTDLVRDHVLREVLDRLAGPPGNAADGRSGTADDGSDPAGPGSTPPPSGDPLADQDLQYVAETLERLRPLSQQVIDAELAMAMDRRVRDAVREWLAGRPHPPAPEPEPPPAPAPEPKPQPEDGTR